MVQNSNFSTALKNLFLGTGGYSPEAQLTVVVFLFGQSSMDVFFPFQFSVTNNDNGCYSYYGFAYACTHD